MCGERLDFHDKGLCKECRNSYELHKSRNCSRCANPLCKCTCSNEHLRSHSVKRHLKVFKYLSTEQSRPGNNLIYSLKRDNREDVVDFLSDELVRVINDNMDVSVKDKYIITSVPRRKSAIVSFGYDHTEFLARAVAKKLGIKYLKLLKSNSKKAQKELRGLERLSNVNFDYASKKDISLKGKFAFIVDDIATTGASLGASATLLKGLGAKECIAVTVASAYNDEYVKRELPKFTY